MEKIRKILKGGGETFFIAEIGKNFIQSKEEKTIEEYLDNAKKLIVLAKEAGADAVKFQTHTVEDEQMDIDVTSPHFSGSDRYSWVKRNTAATPKKFWQEIKDFCEKVGVLFFSTPMSRGAAMLLEEIDVPLWKVGSGDILDFVLLDYLASTKKPIIISTGMSTLEETDLAVDFLKKRGAEIIILHCVSKYPCPPEELRLGTIKFLADRYDVPTGFSDHSIGFDSAHLATSLGAMVIEKHFSTSRELWGSDHKVSMTPSEFKTMVERIRSGTHPAAKGHKGEAKVMQEGEAGFRPFFRKSLVYGQNLKKGAILAPAMIYAMRPQSHIDGLPSEAYESVFDKNKKRKLKHSVKKYQPVRRSDFE